MLGHTANSSHTIGYSNSLQNPRSCYKAELTLLYFVEGRLQAKMRESGEAQKIFKRTFIEMTFL